MPFALLVALTAGVFAVSVSEKNRRNSNAYTPPNPQRDVKLSADGTYKDSYGNAYQRLEDGSLIAVPNYKF